MCGSTDAQNTAQQTEAANAALEQSILKTLTGQQATVFGEDQNLLKSLQEVTQPLIQQQIAEAGSLESTIAAGPNQAGYTPDQEAALRTSATEQTAGQSDQAVRGIDNKTTASPSVTSGAQQQLEAMTRQSGLNENAALQSQITEQGAQLGLQKYNTAVDAASKLGAPLDTAANAFTTTLGAGTSSAGSLSSAGNAATGGASTSMEGATQIQQANDAWLAPLTGLAGSLGGAALGPHPGKG